jgi:serine protease Do
VIVDPDGYIVTNAHVIKGAVTIRVVITRNSLPDEASDDPGNLRTVDAKIVGIDQESDLALLKIDGQGLPTLQFMNSDRLKQGDLVLAIGAPMGLRNSVSFGVVSSPNRSVGDDNPMVYIQTDASINPGNSGGALVTMNGLLAGLNAFIVSQSGGNEGLGFAIPANTVRDVYGQLRKNGRVSRGEIGIYAQDITFVMAKGLSLARDHGVIVSDVVPDGPADRAGLKRRDIILTLDGQRLGSAGQLRSHIYRRASGDKLELRVLRGEDELKVFPVVRERQDKASLLERLIHPEKNLVARLGILCIEIDKEVAEKIPGLRREYGLIVAAKTAGGQSQSIDLQPGDIIDAVNNSPVALLDSLRSTLNDMKPGDPVVLQIERDGRFQYLAFELDR